MNEFSKNQTYIDLRITANSGATEIWLGDDKGFFVQKEIGVLQTSLLPGDYVVEFGLGAPAYPIHLYKNSRYTQQELESGPSCKHPIPDITPSRNKR